MVASLYYLSDALTLTVDAFVVAVSSTPVTPYSSPISLPILYGGSGRGGE